MRTKPKAVIYTDEETLNREIPFKGELRRIRDIYEEEMAEFSLTPMEHAERLIAGYRRYSTVHDANVMRLKHYKDDKKALQDSL